uniref:Putative secreted peptide n=1 Tax=Anopheles braziliensis TaxID=58242 RepID=A0A2M3ZQS9_9DIPT
MKFKSNAGEKRALSWLLLLLATNTSFRDASVRYAAPGVGANTIRQPRWTSARRKTRREDDGTGIGIIRNATNQPAVLTSDVGKAAWPGLGCIIAPASQTGFCTRRQPNARWDADGNGFP